MNRQRAFRHVASGMVVLSVTLAAWAGTPGESLGRVHTTVARMGEERLSAANADAKRYGETRVTVTPRMPLNDYRTVMHAHAEDAVHTGGTRPEMLADAKRAGVQIIFLTDHFRPPKDFITETWRGIHDGVLFVPGSETHGFLIHPMNSIMEHMDKPASEIINVVTEGDGLIFLSHVEERVDHPMDGLTGMEIYNRHADAKDDMTAMVALVGNVTHPEKSQQLLDALAKYPAEMLATQLDYPQLYMDKWDRESQKQRVVGVAANDCHHNQVFIVKKIDDTSVRIGTIVDKDEDMQVYTTQQFPSIADLTQGREPGDVLVSADFDPYYVSFHNVSTHVLAPELTEEAARTALLKGHAYVSHDWMCDPTGFQYLVYKGDPNAAGSKPVALQGDEVPHASDLTLFAEFPVECQVRLLRNGEVLAEETGQTFQHQPEGPGVYRVEGWLKVDGEDRIWIYSNPVYVR